jgi:hypothetical protein
MKTISAPFAYSGFIVCLQSTGKENPSHSDPDLCIIFTGLEKNNPQSNKDICACIYYTQNCASFWKICTKFIQANQP